MLLLADHAANWRQLASVDVSGLWEAEPIGETEGATERFVLRQLPSGAVSGYRYRTGPLCCGLFALYLTWRHSYVGCFSHHFDILCSVDFPESYTISGGRLTPLLDEADDDTTGSSGGMPSPVVRCQLQFFQRYPGETPEGGDTIWTAEIEPQPDGGGLRMVAGCWTARCGQYAGQVFGHFTATQASGGLLGFLGDQLAARRAAEREVGLLRAALDEARADYEHVVGRIHESTGYTDSDSDSDSGSGPNSSERGSDDEDGNDDGDGNEDAVEEAMADGGDEQAGTDVHAGLKEAVDVDPPTAAPGAL